MECVKMGLILLENRKSNFQVEIADKTLSVRTALVYDGRLSPRIEADRFFDFIIPADRLF